MSGIVGSADCSEILQIPNMLQPDGAVRLMPDENLLEGRRHHAVSQLTQVVCCALNCFGSSDTVFSPPSPCLLLRPVCCDAALRVHA